MNQNQTTTSKRVSEPERSEGSLERAGYAARVEALEAWMKEVTALICYQPEIPMKHKNDLAASLNDYVKISEGEKVTRRHNGPDQGRRASDSKQP